MTQNDNNSNQTEILPDENLQIIDNAKTLHLNWTVYEELGYYETAATVVDLRTNKKYTKLTPHWVVQNGFREDLVEEWHPFCLCYDCAYKLGWNGESYCVGQPNLQKEYNCDCCEKTLTKEKGTKYSWGQAIALGLEKMTYEDILKVKNN